MAPKSVTFRRHDHLVYVCAFWRFAQPFLQHYIFNVFVSCKTCFDSQLLIVYCLPPPHNSQKQLGKDLLRASYNGDVRRISEILDDGASVNWRDSYGLTALHEACINNRAEVVTVLLKHNPLINQQTNCGSTPLHVACRRKSIDCVKLLLATGQCDLG